MGLAVTTIASGGMPVTVAANGIAVTEGIGIAVTQVASGGLPVTYAGGTRTGGIAGGSPVDSIANVSGAFGVGALSASWNTGPLYDLLRHDTSATTTIRAVAGYPDVASIAAFLGIDPATGIGGCRMTKWYDQSGHANDLTNASGNVPSLWLVFGRVHVAFSGPLAQSTSMPLQMLMGAGLILNNQSFGFLAAYSSYDSIASGTPAKGGFTAIGGIGFSSIVATDVAFVDQSSGSSSAAPDAVGPKSAVANYTAGTTVTTKGVGTYPTVMATYGSSVDTWLWNNNDTSGEGAAHPAGSNSLIVGNETEQVYPFGGRIQAIVVTSTAPAAPQLLAAQAAIAAWANIDMSINHDNNVANIVWDGASSTIGHGGSPDQAYQVYSGGGYGFAEMVKDLLGLPRVSSYNLAISGNTTAQCAAVWSGGFGGKTFQPGTPKNVLIGPNDSIGNDGASTGAQMYSNYQGWLSAVKALGLSWYRIACILLPPLGNTAYGDFITLMKANAASNGIALIDASGWVPGGGDLWGDGHLKCSGHYALAQYCLTYLRSLGLREGDKALPPWRAATAAAGPARNAPARRARPSVMDPDEMEDEIEQAIDDGDVEMGR
jgi:hypothetical protein